VLVQLFASQGRLYSTEFTWEAISFGAGVGHIEMELSDVYCADMNWIRLGLISEISL
jgi:hypothetical protein